ncbi:putative Retrotransposon protein, Ty3-gypsy subclass [Hibiscus syriacus]|uniref:Retrotransposon protein, Ty3-gypsy subclass n=1 Tax=Hibiscus syriacus TaxID=106335 RepID=A0A6A2WMV4_HIBSY|nr:putative Retrotransposon protein, Ty3-gypsy subclass [Hibiscus syriacus]
MELLLSLCLLSLLASTTDGSNDWLNHGGNILNRRFADTETKISLRTASRLRLKWEFYAGGDISATPAIFDGTLYFPSWNGYLYAVKALDGSLVWKKNLRQLTGLNSTVVISNVDANATVSRTTPVIADDLLIIGLSGPAYVVAVRRSNGRLVWLTQLDKHYKAVITMSGTYYKGHFYVGTSSLEVTVGIEQCCFFRGSFVKLNARTGKILWRTYMLPDNFGRLGEYAGAALWGSSPSIDIRRNHVYIATGNLYSAPKRVRDCQERLNNRTDAPSNDECVEPENHSDSILALDLDSGKIMWFNQLGGYDVWFFECNNNVSNPKCPPGPNQDADFAAAPMMITTYVNGTKRDLAVAVQKSGVAWALDRDNGNLIWSTQAGPGGLSGGGIWGAATDERRVYTNIANSGRKNFTLKPSKKVTNAGGWVALDSKNGNILWSTADPSNATVSGPVTVANGVLLGGSTFKQGPIYAMSAITGKILWPYNTGATIYGGASVSKGCVYIGHGYKVSLGFMDPGFTAGDSLLAFCVS